MSGCVIFCCIIKLLLFDLSSGQIYCYEWEAKLAGPGVHYNFDWCRQLEVILFIYYLQEKL